MARLRAFIFHMSIPCDKTFLLVLSSKASIKVKVKYQGHSFRKNGHCRGIGVSQTHLVHFVILLSADHAFNLDQSRILLFGKKFKKHYRSM